ncbi:hypothetical protein SCUCBS95973_004737 [Sporothrix curviconia]|uniref:Xylanolytic transcriptional activator regulatory domain-containing protein n=1 Tax=Sporothrix curviconia TaxID=1260050 RepID=A0ABP0BR08_9PEZI
MQTPDAPLPPGDGTPQRRPVKRPRPILNCAGESAVGSRFGVIDKHTLGSMRSIRSRVSQMERAQLWPPCDDDGRERAGSSQAESTPGRSSVSASVSAAGAGAVAAEPSISSLAGGSPTALRQPDVVVVSATPPGATEPQPGTAFVAAATTAATDATREADGVGTLVVNADGRSKFIGQSASFQWLRDETKEQPETRPASPSRHFPPEAFPFQGQRGAPYSVNSGNGRGDGSASGSRGDFAGLWAQLPPKEEALHLVTCFHRYIAWNGSPLLEEDLLAVLRWLYGLGSVGLVVAQPQHPNMAVQLLALLYIVLALGSLTNMELAPDDPASMAYYRLSQQCLVAGKFLVNNSLTTVQALSLMAKYTAYVGMPDMSWQIRGMAMRIILAMGLHRDGESWGLSSKDLNNRRRTFWETYSTDILISCNWDRPSGLHTDMFDTKFPDDMEENDVVQPGMSGPRPEDASSSSSSSSNPVIRFLKQRCLISMLAQEALQESLKIRSDYQRMRAIGDKVLALERQVPFHLRNRAALQFMASRYATQAAAEADTPPPTRDLRLVFQSHDLIDCTSSLLLSMFRPYFIRAVKAAAAAGPAADPTAPTSPSLASPYAEAFLAVVERSRMLIANLLSLHALFPRISTRHWFFWNHAFSGAVIMATLCIANPGGPLVEQARSDLNAIIAVYTAIQPTVPYPWVARNLQWLLEVRAKAEEKMLAFRTSQAVQPPNILRQQPPVLPPDEEGDATENPLLVGWRQRLVELRNRDMGPVDNLLLHPGGTHGLASVVGGVGHHGSSPIHGAPGPPGHQGPLFPVEPDVPDTLNLTSLNLDVSDADLLSQLLDLTAEGPQYVAPLKDMAMFDFVMPG